MSSGAEIDEAITQNYHVEESLNQYIRNVATHEGVEFIGNDRLTATDVSDLKKKSETVPIVRLVNSIIYQAVTQKASDIHIEPQDKSVVIRNRVDGILSEAIREYIGLAVYNYLGRTSELFPGP